MNRNLYQTPFAKAFIKEIEDEGYCVKVFAKHAGLVPDTCYRCLYSKVAEDRQLELVKAMRRLGFKSVSVRICLDAYAKTHGVGRLPKLLPQEEQDAIANQIISRYMELQP